MTSIIYAKTFELEENGVEMINKLYHESEENAFYDVLQPKKTMKPVVINHMQVGKKLVPVKWKPINEAIHINKAGKDLPIKEEKTIKIVQKQPKKPPNLKKVLIQKEKNVGTQNEVKVIVEDLKEGKDIISPGFEVVDITKAPDLSGFSLVTQNSVDREIFIIQNQLRKDPQSFLKHLDKIAQTADVKKVKKAIMRMKEKLKPLKWSEGLALAARDHCNDIGQSGIQSSVGRDQSSVFDRIARYGQSGWYRGENIHYGQKSPMNIVIDLLIDNKLHRRGLLSPRLKITGIYSCKHKTKKGLTVINYAQSLLINQKAVGILSKMKDRAVQKRQQDKAAVKKKAVFIAKEISNGTAIDTDSDPAIKAVAKATKEASTIISASKAAMLAAKIKTIKEAAREAATIKAVKESVKIKAAQENTAIKAAQDAALAAAQNKENALKIAKEAAQMKVAQQKSVKIVVASKSAKEAAVREATSFKAAKEAATSVDTKIAPASNSNSKPAKQSAIISSAFKALEKLTDQPITTEESDQTAEKKDQITVRSQVKKDKEDFNNQAHELWKQAEAETMQELEIENWEKDSMLVDANEEDFNQAKPTGSKFKNKIKSRKSKKRNKIQLPFNFQLKTLTYRKRTHNKVLGIVDQQVDTEENLEVENDGEFEVEGKLRQLDEESTRIRKKIHQVEEDEQKAQSQLQQLKKSVKQLAAILAELRYGNGPLTEERKTASKLQKWKDYLRLLTKEVVITQIHSKIETAKLKAELESYMKKTDKLQERLLRAQKRNSHKRGRFLQASLQKVRSWGIESNKVTAAVLFGHDSLLML